MPLDITNIHAICFDIDGTLRDTDDQVVNLLTNMLRPLRFLFPGGNPQPFARRFVMTTEDIGNYIIGLPDRMNIDHHIARLGNYFYHRGLSFKPKPPLIVNGVEKMLSRLKPHYPMAIVSAGSERSVQAFLNQFELNQYFICIATAQTCRHTKPYPDPIYWAAEQMSVAPINCLMVGDTTVDIRAGKAAGAQTVGVLCGFGEQKELINTGADQISPNIGNLADILIGKNH